MSVDKGIKFYFYEMSGKKDNGEDTDLWELIKDINYDVYKRWVDYWKE